MRASRVGQGKGGRAVSSKEGEERGGAVIANSNGRTVQVGWMAELRRPAGKSWKRPGAPAKAWQSLERLQRGRRLRQPHHAAMPEGGHDGAGCWQGNSCLFHGLQQGSIVSARRQLACWPALPPPPWAPRTPLAGRLGCATPEDIIAPCCRPLQRDDAGRRADGIWDGRQLMQHMPHRPSHAPPLLLLPVAGLAVEDARKEATEAAAGGEPSAEAAFEFRGYFRYVVCACGFALALPSPHERCPQMRRVIT